jgi:poly(3-hydroxybutyrate) depolymerase
MKQLCLFGLSVSVCLSVACSPSEGGPNGGQPTSGASGAPAVPSAGTGGDAGGAQAGSASGGAAGGAGVAGTGGDAGGVAGSGGAAGSAGAGSSPMDPSTGCGKPATQELDEWVRYTVMAADLEREYFVRLPEDYDAQKPYRLLFTFPGCGGRGDGVLPLYNAPMADAIVVGPSPDGECFVYQENSKDTAFFDAMLPVVQDSYCVDQNRIFTSGHSSGSWFSNVLGCFRSDIVRAQGNIAGGFPGNGNNCLPNNIAAIFIHDLNDEDNDIEGSIRARDRLLTLNGCGTETQPIEPSPCVEYQGCMAGYPVVWCQTMGQGHARQDALSVPAIYDFFARF